MQIVIQPIAWSSSELKYNTSSMVFSLIQHLSKIFEDIASIDSSNLEAILRSSSSSSSTTIPPMHLFDRDRKQWISDRVLDWLLQNNNPSSNTKVLAICDFDAYSDNLNFVFGEAHLGGRIAAIYLTRLRNEFYVKKSNISRLFEQRVIKEAVHELGHVFGLRHCENSKCVMHFSNSLQDTDFKNERFCEICNEILRGRQYNK